ncbi:MAG: hypothetical protein AAGD01_12130 [Acidobacteriota bacterium]
MTRKAFLEASRSAGSAGSVEPHCDGTAHRTPIAALFSAIFRSSFGVP